MALIFEMDVIYSINSMNLDVITVQMTMLSMFKRIQRRRMEVGDTYTADVQCLRGFATIKISEVETGAASH